MKKFPVRSLVVVLAACFVLCGCGDTLKGKSVADPQIAVFHADLNAKRFDEIYAAAGDEFRKAAPKEKSLQLFAAIEKS